jgi:hypothetical protein
MIGIEEPMSVDFTPDPKLYPFVSRWFDGARGRMHYVDEGTGTPIVLCHGNPTWSFLYRDTIIALRDHSAASRRTISVSGSPSVHQDSATRSKGMPEWLANLSITSISTPT